MSENYASDAVSVFSDSESFFNQLTTDVLNAQKSVRIQCMSFEADSVGTKLIELLASKPTLDRTLLIDHYSRFVVNDTFLKSPWGWLNKNNARVERKALEILITRAREMGIRIKFISPMGFLMRRYPMRNHKKMILIDDHISYVGGMNFTEHNFRWADMMIRHTDPAISEALLTSFDADLNDTRTEVVQKINNTTTMYLLDGWKSRSSYKLLMDQIRSSDKVVAVSPYISYPVLDAIAEVEENTVILPKNNNKAVFKFIHGLKRYSNINFHYVDGEMLHAKLLILNDETAIYGSSNFDFVSYFFEKEVVLTNNDQHLLNQFKSIIEGFSK